MPRIRTFRELRQILTSYDSQFEFYINRGKGSERMIFHPNISGRAESLPVKCHGEGDEVGRYIIADLVRRFGVPRRLFTAKQKKKRSQRPATDAKPAQATPTPAPPAPAADEPKTRTVKKKKKQKKPKKRGRKRK